MSAPPRPRVSVIVPARDAAATVRAALESILAASAPALELIVVDDGSRDETRDVVSGVASRDARVTLVQAAGSGIAAALNQGLAVAQGELVARMDADDLSHPERLGAQVARFDADRSGRLGALGTQVESFGSTPTEGFVRYLAWQNSLLSADEHARDVFVDAPLCHPSVMLRHATLGAMGGYREGPIAEDYDLFLRLHRAGFGLEKLPRVLLRWRRHERQTTFTDARLAPESLRALKASHLAPLLRGDGRRLLMWGAGRDGRRFARALAREGLVARGFVDIDPKKLGRTAQGSPVLPMDAIRPDQDVVVAAVGVAGARALIREHLLSIGMHEGRDFFCVA